MKLYIITKKIVLNIADLETARAKRTVEAITTRRWRRTRPDSRVSTATETVITRSAAMPATRPTDRCTARGRTVASVRPLWPAPRFWCPTPSNRCHPSYTCRRNTSSNNKCHSSWPKLPRSCSRCRTSRKAPPCSRTASRNYHRSCNSNRSARYCRRTTCNCPPCNYPPVRRQDST